MRSLGKISAATLVTLITTSALAQEYTVKSASCVSGQLNPAGTLQVGDKLKEDDLKNSGYWFQQNGNDAVLLVNSLGNNNDGGACNNNSQRTLLVITFSK